MLTKHIYLNYLFFALLLLTLSACASTPACPPTCIGANLMNVNWEGKNLQGVNLSKANLSRANLAKADLSRADLRGADLRGATLDGATLKDATLVGARLDNARMVTVNLENADLSGTVMTNATMIRANLNNVKMDGCDLSEALMAGADLIAVRISGCSLNSVKLYGADLSNAVLSGDDLNGADFSGASLTGADLSGSNLANAIMVGARLTQAKLTGATLTNAILDGADLRIADLQGANLRFASIKGASLDRANLASVDLTGANLQGSVLTETTLSMARFADVITTESGQSFQTAQLGGASLNRADLSYAYLAGVSMRGTSLQWAKMSNATLRESVLINGQNIIKQADFIGAIREQAGLPASSAQTTPFPTAPVSTPAAPQPVATPQSSGAQPSTLYVGTQEGVFTLNPLAPLTVMAANALDQIYETMFQLSPDGTYHPLLAQSYNTSEDGKTFTFSLPQNAKFHDGFPLTAQDVVFSYNLYRDTWNVSFIQETKIINENTVEVTLAEPVQNIGFRLGQLYILPEHIWKPLLEQGINIQEYDNSIPVGSGPFKLAEYKSGETIRFSAFTDHWAYPPKISAMVWQTYTQQDKMIQALISGQLDMINDVPISAINALKSAPRIQVVNGPPAKPSLRDVIINQIDPKNCPEDGKCTGNPALRDLNVRRALALATDKQKIIQVTMRGMATPGLTLVADQLTEWFNPTLQDYAFDLDQANQLLDQTGYVDVNNDSIREMPDKTTSLFFRLYYPSGYPSYTYERLAEILNQNWSAIGIRLDIKAVEEDSMHALTNPGFDYDIALWGWGGIQPDPSNLLSVITTRSIESGRSENGYSNPEYDTLFDQQKTELDFTKRQEMIYKMQEIMLNDVVYIIPYYEQAAYAFRTDRFSGWASNQPKVIPLFPGNLSAIAPVR